MSARSFADPQADTFRREVREWLTATVPIEWAHRFKGDADEGDQIAVRRQWDRIVSDGGYGGLSWPKSAGGRELGPIEEFIFFEEAAAVHVPDMLNYIGFDLAGPAIIAYGTDDQKERFLPAILKGEELWCEGFSEPNAGSDLAAASTTGVKVDGGYEIHGQKIWTSGAHIADRCYLLVRTSTSAPRHHNLSLLLVDMHQKGIEIRPIRQITDEYEFNEVFFDGAFATTEDRLGEENEGWVLGTLSGFRQGRRIFDALRRYVLIRSAMDQIEECGRELGRSWDPRLARDVELLKRHTMRCTEMLALGRDITQSATILKLIWSQLWQRLTDVGLSLGCDAHESYWRHDHLYARSVTIAGGTAQIQRNVIADRILELPRS